MPYHSYLEKGGEMGHLIRSYNWSATSLGEPVTWSQSLLTSINIMLNSRFPMLIFWGKDLVTFYNDAFRPSLGSDGKHPSSLGQRGEESWAESWPVIGSMIYNIMSGGDAIWFEDQKLPIYREGKMGYAYWTYSFSPIADDNGQVGGVLVTCSETTKAVEAVIELEQSESRFQNLVREATVGIIVLTGSDMRIDIVNDAYAKLIGHRASELLGKRLFTVIPQAEDYFRPVIEKVRTEEKPVYLNNTPYSVLDDKGEKAEGFLNLVYQPYIEANGAVIGVIVLCQDVTGQVQASQTLARQYEKEQKLNTELATANEELAAGNEELRALNEELWQTQESLLEVNNRLTKSEEKLRLTMEASNLGSWYIDAVTREFIPSPRLKELFGYDAGEVMPYDVAVLQIKEEYRADVVAAVEAAITESKLFNVEFPLIGYHNARPRWVRASGKLYTADNNQPATFFGTVEDITERRQDEQRKNDFIGMVSHEMKTPLTSMSAYLQMLQVEAEAGDNNYALMMLQRANKQVDKMTTMINGFLNISRLESGKLNINETRFDMADLMKEAEEETRSLYTTHHIIFHPAESITVNADKDKIGHVINNLISNAMKYSPLQSNINISCVLVSDNKVQVSVKDEGTGIAPEDQNQLFERYYRVKNNTTQSISGFGIGLYLCAEIIKRHNGNIGIKSELGKGSVFYFTLPVAV